MDKNSLSLLTTALLSYSPRIHDPPLPYAILIEYWVDYLQL